MAKIVFDADSAKKLERGVNHCVLYVAAAQPAVTGKQIKAAAGVPWNGISKVSDSPEGGDVTDIYADNILFGQLQALEKYKGNIEAYMWPDEFNACEGLEEDFGSGSPATSLGVYYAQQERKKFHLCYCTQYIKEGVTYNKYHLLYNLLAAPSSKDYETINDGADAVTFSWDISSTPISDTTMLPSGKGQKGVSHIIIDEALLPSGKKAALEAAIYGTDGSGTSGTDAYIPSPNELHALVTE